jgi:ATP-dependent Clp protease ATP-binding subunit ClpB
VQGPALTTGVELTLAGGLFKTIVPFAGDPGYGARPLKRAIQKEILDPLRLQILEGKFHEGQTIRVEEKGGS